jgi:7-keto-8-aminopelargonate synthetase-like enzyme
MLLIEGLYSMDGDIPDLPAFAELRQRHQALLLVDECLSIGVLGDSGRGIAEHYGVSRSDADIWMGGISKAFASCGGYIAGDVELINYLRYSAPGSVYTTGLSPANAAAALASIRVLMNDPGRPRLVRGKARRFRDMAQARGLDTGTSEGHLVIPIIVGDSVLCLRLYQALLAAGISTQPVLYPAVPDGTARLRLFVTHSHTDDDLEKTADLIREKLSALEGTIRCL